MEETHKQIEQYLQANVGVTGLKFSFLEDNARDFTKQGSPLLYDGDDDHIIFTVIVQNSGSAAISDSYRRLVGTIRIQCYIGGEKSDREYYRLADKLRSFLESKSFGGVSLREFSNVNPYKLGKWNVRPSVVSFKTTKQRI